MTKHIRTENGPQTRLGIRGRGLRRCDHPGGGDFVREPCDLVDEVGEDAEDGGGPVYAGPAADAGVEDYTVEVGEGGCEAAGEGADGEEVGEVDGFWVEGYLVGGGGGGRRGEVGLKAA